MTLDETAEHLKVSKETIYKMAQKGKIPGSKLGSQWRFNQQSVDEWLKASGKPCTEKTENNHAEDVANG
jgi:excisionase family DNA binding protein